MIRVIRWPLLTGALLAAMAVSGGELQLRVGTAAFGVPVTSLKEARFATTVRQRYDFSCGSAATATLLTYQYGHPVTEAEVFMAMYTRGDRAKIQRDGFSLLDIQRYLQSLGYHADGFELPLDKLLEEGLPAIVLLDDKGYRHFVVIKGIRRGRILVGDPARGTRALSRGQFDALWGNGVLFVVHNRRPLATFNHARDWRSAPPAPLGVGIPRESLQAIVLPIRGPGDI